MRTLRALFVLLVLGLSACDEATPDGPTDAGGRADAGDDRVDAGSPDGRDAGSTPDDAGSAPVDAGPGACEAPRAVELVMGAQTLTGDLTGRRGIEACAWTWGPTEALALTLPGAGPLGIEVDLRSTGHPPSLVVREDCESAEGERCFVPEGETLPGSVFTATGGDTLFALVSSEWSSGDLRWQMHVTVEPNVAPTLTAATAHYIDGLHQFEVTGGDADANADVLRVVYLEGAVELGSATYRFLDPVAGRSTFSTLARATGVYFDDPGLEPATHVRLSIVDAYGGASAPLTVPLTFATQAAGNAPCGPIAICEDAFVCSPETGLCDVRPAAQAACAAAPAITAPGSFTGTIPAGLGSVWGRCGNTRGGEVVYALVLETSAWVTASTDVPATGDSNTVVYLQWECGWWDGSPSNGCNDDAGEGNVRSTVSSSFMPRGTNWLFVDGSGWAAEPRPFGLTVSWIPAPGENEPCDPTGTANRCAPDLVCTGASPICRRP